ncbi:MAG TPA: CDP-alcohol phosphatidyltransferase family protein [Dissulfurispiraceae bacterium]|nr:CDP-alcohol phosphatidyltransferase family protein [Dissulfurispiraceae bacterium]
MDARILTLPNLITCIRILLIPVFISAILADRYRDGLVVFVVAALSDLVDGKLARAQNSQTTFGAFLDPFADKCLMISSFILFATKGWLPMWLALVSISRDLLVVLGYVLLAVMRGMVRVSPSLAGKTAIAAEMILISYVLLWLNFAMLPEPALWMFVCVAALAASSGVQYIYRGVMTLYAKPCGQ